jgi:4-hydroxybenzoate polyprenyltransferase
MALVGTTAGPAPDAPPPDQRGVAAPGFSNALAMLLLMPAIAASCVIVVQIYLDQSVGLLPALPVAALALMIYALNGVSDRAEDRLNDPAKANALAQNGWPLIAVASAALLVSAILLARTGRLHIVYGLILVAGLFYSFRLVPWYQPSRGLTRLRLKDVLLLKNLSVGLTWAASVFVVPIMDHPSAPPAPGYWVLAAGYGFLATMNSVFSDLKDQAGDRAAGVLTLPVVVGAPRCFRLMMGAAGLWLLLLVGAYVGPRWIDGGAFIFLAMMSLGYPALVWAAREGNLVPRSAVAYVIEASDPIFMLGLLLLAWRA